MTDPRHTGIRKDDIIRHPLIQHLGELTTQLTGVRLLIVYPTTSGWQQEAGDAQTGTPATFCKLIQGSGEGARPCRMCHVLMAVAACNDGPALQRCHAGATVMVCPVPSDGSESIAVLGSCTVAEPEAWRFASERGRKLGVDMRKLAKAFRELPRMDSQWRDAVESAMKTMAVAIQFIRQGQKLEAQLLALEEKPGPKSDLSRHFKEAHLALGAVGRRMSPKAGHIPLLVRVVCKLVEQRPEMPFKVKELAPAARVTQNYFSTIFRRWTKESFPEYVARHRVKRAGDLLHDLTLNINEIARLVGYDDPAYFSRLFRQKTGLSPRKWRERGGSAMRKSRPASANSRSYRRKPSG